MYQHAGKLNRKDEICDFEIFFMFVLWLFEKEN